MTANDAERFRLLIAKWVDRRTDYQEAYWSEPHRRTAIQGEVKVINRCTEELLELLAQLRNEEPKIL